MDYGTQRIVNDGNSEAFDACRQEMLSKLKLRVPVKVAWSATDINTLEHVMVIEVEKISGGIRAHCVTEQGKHYSEVEDNLCWE